MVTTAMPVLPPGQWSGLMSRPNRFSVDCRPVGLP
jgi:hypothetical protein